MFAHQLTGALLCAGYHVRNSERDEIVSARLLLHSAVPVIVAHSLEDHRCNPDSHPQYWYTLLRAQLGGGRDDRNANCILQTFVSASHNEFIPYFEGLGKMTMTEVMQQSFKQSHADLLNKLNEVSRLHL